MSSARTIDRGSKIKYMYEELGMTIREIQRELGMSTPSLVHHYIKKMRLHKVNVEELKSRIWTLEQENKYLKSQLKKVFDIQVDSRKVL